MKPLAYFEARVEKDGATGCWNWKRAVNSYGYGWFGDSNVKKKAHRGAWEAVNGPIQRGLWVLHRCDNPPCVNPAHLFLGTNSDNVADCVAKGRQAKGSGNGQSKLTEHDISIIKMLLGLGVRGVRLAALYGVCKQTISDIKRGLIWKDVTPMEVSP